MPRRERLIAASQEKPRPVAVQGQGTISSPAQARGKKLGAGQRPPISRPAHRPITRPAQRPARGIVAGAPRPGPKDPHDLYQKILAKQARGKKLGPGQQAFLKNYQGKFGQQPPQQPPPTPTRPAPQQPPTTPPPPPTQPTQPTQPTPPPSQPVPTPAPSDQDQIPPSAPPPQPPPGQLAPPPAAGRPNQLAEEYARITGRDPMSVQAWMGGATNVGPGPGAPPPAAPPPAAPGPPAAPPAAAPPAAPGPGPSGPQDPHDLYQKILAKQARGKKLGPGQAAFLKNYQEGKFGQGPPEAPVAPPQAPAAATPPQAIPPDFRPDLPENRRAAVWRAQQSGGATSGGAGVSNARANPVSGPRPFTATPPQPPAAPPATPPPAAPAPAAPSPEASRQLLQQLGPGNAPVIAQMIGAGAPPEAIEAKLQEWGYGPQIPAMMQLLQQGQAAGVYGIDQQQAIEGLRAQFPDATDEQLQAMLWSAPAPGQPAPGQPAPAPGPGQPAPAPGPGQPAPGQPTTGPEAASIQTFLGPGNFEYMMRGTDPGWTSLEEVGNTLRSYGYPPDQIEQAQMFLAANPPPAWSQKSAQQRSAPAPGPFNLGAGGIGGYNVGGAPFGAGPQMATINPVTGQIDVGHGIPPGGRR